MGARDPLAFPRRCRLRRNPAALVAKPALSLRAAIDLRCAFAAFGIIAPP